MEHENVLIWRPAPSCAMGQKTGGNFAGIYWVHQDALGLCHQHNCIQAFFGSIAVAATNKFIVYLNCASILLRVLPQQAADLVPPFLQAFVADLTRLVHADTDDWARDSLCTQSNQQRGKD